MLATLDFHFRKQDESYTLEVYQRDKAQTFAASTFDFPLSFLTGFEIKQLGYDAKDPAARVERLEAFGRKLYQKIFTPDVEKVWNEHKDANDLLVLCIRIDKDATELESLAWEALHDGAEFITAGKHTTITRLPLDVPPQDALPLVPLPLKMLALVSSPLDLGDGSRLQMEREQEILLEAINDPAGQGRLRADFEDEAKIEILESSLETPYQIFHFTGHGIAPEQGGGLLLEDAKGESRPTSVVEVLQSLGRGEKTLRLCVLSGCQTARTINAAGFSDMARGLLRQKIPSVIAMQFSISDVGGLKFAEEFYKRLAEGKPLEDALHKARRVLLSSDDYILKGDAIAPVLLTSNGDCLKTTERLEETTTDAPVIDFSFYLPLPQLSHGFYGRRREYRRIRDGILQKNQRACIIHGIGGIGKTALVSHIATRLKKRFKGVYAFDCSSGTLTPETVMIKLHQYLAQQGINVLEKLLFQNLPPDFLATTLSQVLSQWSVLLIFDNFETQLERAGDSFQIADENLRAFITTLVKTTATGSHFLFTSRYLFNLDDKRLGNIQSQPLEDLSTPEALSLMQKLQHLSQASYREKLEALKTFGGHPYALVALDRYCNHRPLSQALADAESLHAELREFLAIELNYTRLSERARELLNRFAAFRQPAPYEAAEWVMGEKVSYAAAVLENNRDKLPEEWKGLDDAEILQKLERVLPEQRQAEDLSHPLRELIDWGLFTPIYEDEQLKWFSVHALVRDFCRDKQKSETWCVRLRDAAAFYTNQTKLMQQEQKSQAAIWTEMDAFELLMEAEDFKDAASLLSNTTPLLVRWGFVHYLESHYHRLFDKLDAKGIAFIMHNLGVLAQRHGNYDKALNYYQRALKIYEELSNLSGVASSFHQIGRVYELQDKYDKALEYFAHSLKIQEKINDQSGIANSFHNIAITYQHRGEFEKALEYFAYSLKIQEEINDQSGIASSLHNIGIIYQRHGKHEKATEHFFRSLEIQEELGNRSGIANSLGQIGTIYDEQGKPEKALSYYERSLTIQEELGNRSGVAASLHNIGVNHKHLGEYDKALEYFIRSLNIKEELGNRSGIANSLGQIGELFIEIERYGEALKHLLSSLCIFAELQSLQSPNAGMTLVNLKRLREKWGEAQFDGAWKAETGADVPEWLKGSATEE